MAAERQLEMTITSPPGTYLPPGATAPVADRGGTYSGWDATATTQDPAGTYSSPFALNETVFEWSQRTSTVPMVWTSETAVANFYGETSPQAAQASAFFGANYDGIGQFITVRVGLGQRCHLIGANLSGDTLAELQAIQGSVALTFDGFHYSGNVDLSSLTSPGFAGVQEAGHLLQIALNADRQTAAATTGDTIVPETAKFWGYAQGQQLYVTDVVSGTVAIGGYVTGKGLGTGTVAQIIADRGPTTGAEHYSIFFADGNTGSAANPVLMTETYGMLTIGGVKSGTVSTGLEITDAANDIAPNTAIDYNLSGTTGAGSQWVVNNAQSWSASQAALKAPPITVSEDGNGVPIYGKTAPNDFLSVTSNPAYGFDQDPSSLSYLTGAAADALGLSQDTAVSDASPGGQFPTMAAFIDSVVTQLGSLGTGFAKFANVQRRFRNEFASWVAKHPGYKFLQGGTPPSGSSLPVTDPPGTWSAPGASAPTIDKPGSYSLAGASAPTLAQASQLVGGQWEGGYYVPTAGASAETADDPGYYTPRAGMSKEIPIPPGTFMLSGSHLLSDSLLPAVSETRVSIRDASLDLSVAVGHAPGPA
jgi:hypothetical protein